jgi:ABC-2 type transport system permease protein
MPLRVQMYSHLFPARHFNVVSRGVLLKGLGFADLWPEFLILSLYAAVVFTIAALRFRKKVA